MRAQKLRYLWREVTAWALILILQLFALAPILAAAMVGDDLINPFQQFVSTGDSLRQVFNYAIVNATGHKFNLVGHLIWAGHLHLWLDFDALFELDHKVFYRLTKFIVFTFAMFSLALFTRSFLRLSSQVVPNLKSIYVIGMIGLTSTLQIHSHWSNDPVANYPMSGYASAGFGFLALDAFLRFAHSPTRKRALIASAASIVAILYYEINVALIPVLLMMLLLFRFMGHKPQISIIQSLYVLAPSIFITILGRLSTLEDSTSYGGTTIGTFSGFLKALFIGSISTLPSSAWRLTKDFVPNISIEYWQLGLLAFTLMGFVSILVWVNQSNSLAQVKLSYQWILLGIGAAASYSITALGIQAVTEKYQNELYRVGTVYSFYSIGSMCIVFVFTILLINFVGVTKMRIINMIIISLLTSLAMVQGILNWSLVNNINSVMNPSQVLISTFSSESTDIQRCDAWNSWASIQWPEYYETYMGQGLNNAMVHYFGSDFCSSGTTYVP
jgi:hypothetical protein